MIPNRAPIAKTQCLTMFSYQEMPLIPASRNRYTEKIVAAQDDLPKSQSIQPVKKNRNPGRKKGMTKEQLGAFHRAAAIVKCRVDIDRIFANGPITVAELGQHTSSAHEVCISVLPSPVSANIAALPRFNAHLVIAR